jgi:hypothetical protein
MGLINWPQRKPVPTATNSVKKSTTTISKAASVDSLSAQIETTTPDSIPRRSSEGNQSCPSLTESPRLGAADCLRKALGDTGLSAMTFASKGKFEAANFDAGDGLPRIEEESLMKMPSTQTRIPLVVENPSWIDLPSSPVSSAIGASADSVETHSLPDPMTPMEFARFGYISRESFNTSVLPLLQPTPDSPIGGQAAAPMSVPSFVQSRGSYYFGTRKINGTGEFLEPPRIEVSSPKDSISGYEKGRRTVLRSHSNFSDPCYNSPSVGPVSRPQSPKTPVMVTAPQTPKRGKGRQSSNSSFDGAASEDDEDDDDDCGLEAEKGSCGGDEQGPEPCYASGCDANETPTYQAFTTELLPGGTIPSIDGMGGMPAAPGPEMPTVAGLADTPDLPQLPNVGEVVPAPSVPTALGVPVDGTGMASTPPTPSRRQRFKSKRNAVASKGVRKMRKVILTKPVLNMIVGRKLAKPTQDLLKLVASGVPFELPDIESIAPVQPHLPAPLPA